VLESKVLRIGQQAPDFEVVLHTGETFRLSEERGRRQLVLCFYPKDFTFGCTKEACAFTRHFDDIKRLNAVVIGISPDSLEIHKKFAAQYQLPFSLGSDPRLELAGTYDAVWLNGKAMRRVTYVIDKGGVIRLAAHHEFFINNHSRETITILESLNEASL
jgi:peroxiredoxin Q/BCP